jgi:hypothetical protein
MPASFRRLAVLSLALVACGEPAPPAPGAVEAALRSPGCDQGLPVVLHGRLLDVAHPPLQAIARVTVLLYGREGESVPLARAVLEGGDLLPPTYALCADPAQLEAEAMPIAVAHAEMEDLSRLGTSGAYRLGFAVLPLQMDLLLHNRTVRQLQDAR